jgi:hypothetical protein
LQLLPDAQLWKRLWKRAGIPLLVQADNLPHIDTVVTPSAAAGREHLPDLRVTLGRSPSPGVDVERGFGPPAGA